MWLTSHNAVDAAGTHLVITAFIDSFDKTTTFQTFHNILHSNEKFQTISFNANIFGGGTDGNSDSETVLLPLFTPPIIGLQWFCLHVAALILRISALSARISWFAAHCVWRYVSRLHAENWWFSSTIGDCRRDCRSVSAAGELPCRLDAWELIATDFEMHDRKAPERTRQPRAWESSDQQRITGKGKNLDSSQQAIWSTNMHSSRPVTELIEALQSGMLLDLNAAKSIDRRSFFSFLRHSATSTCRGSTEYCAAAVLLLLEDKFDERQVIARNFSQWCFF